MASVSSKGRDYEIKAGYIVKKIVYAYNRTEAKHFE